MEDVQSVIAMAKVCILGSNIFKRKFWNLLTIRCLIQALGIFFGANFPKKTWSFVLNHHKRHLPLLTKIFDLPWRQIKNLDFLESFHYENLSAGKILCCLYSDLLLQLHNFQLDFWLRNTGSKKLCSMSLSIETNGKTVEPLNFPVFSIPTQKKDLPNLLTEKNYPLKHWWKP